jgi:hypothetical protein
MSGIHSSYSRNSHITESLQKLRRGNQGIPDCQRRQESAENVGAETR